MKTSEHVSLPPTNPELLQLIRQKREWHWKPSVAERKAGFRGWHQRGYLPHFDAPNVTQLVTFLLHDSFPPRRRAEWEPLLSEADHSERRRKLETWLDRGCGECWLREPAIAAIVENAILAGAASTHYQPLAWVVMLNHVHVVIHITDVPMTKIIKTWKGSSATTANRRLLRAGSFWQEDYYDTLIRDESHLQKAVRYVEANPVKANLVKTSQDWAWSSARNRDEFGRLQLEH